MGAVHSCAICSKKMDPNQWGELHIIKRATGEEKHAPSECLARDPARARTEGFLHEESTSTS